MAKTKGATSAPAVANTNVDLVQRTIKDIKKMSIGELLEFKRQFNKLNTELADIIGETASVKPTIPVNRPVSVARPTTPDVGETSAPEVPKARLPLSRRTEDISDDPDSLFTQQPQEEWTPPDILVEEFGLPPLRRKGKRRTMAEQTGAYELPAERNMQKVSRESQSINARDVLGRPQVSSVESANVSASVICPENMRENQPTGYRPYEILITRIQQFVDNPNTKNGAALLRRVKTGMYDAPSIPTLDAAEVGINPIILLGRELQKSTNKLMLGYVQPSVLQVEQAWAGIHDLLQAWMENRDLESSKRPVDSSTITARTASGRLVTDSNGVVVIRGEEAPKYRTNLYIYMPHDYPGQIAVAVV